MRIRESVAAKLALTVLAAIVIAAVAVVLSPKSHATPILKCSPYVPFVGRWCDQNWQPDGSYMHCLDSWGGLDCSWVCPLEGNPVNPPLAPNGPGSCGRPVDTFGPARY